MKVTERSVQEIGKSLFISLPKAWADGLKITKGATLKILVGEEGRLSIAPEFVHHTPPAEAVIPLDDQYERRFFREYFNGCTKVTFTNARQFTHRAEFYSFLKRFINIQIIDDTTDRIVVKAYEINELTIPECLKRMHFLSLTIMDSAQDTPRQAAEIRDSITRFYYLLVLQVRRYLSEGKFAHHGEIPLLRAMDMRMAAEKIQRISDAVCNRTSTTEKNLKQARDFYAHAFSSFINEQFTKALEVWEQAKILEKSLKTKPTPVASAIVKYAKEISMLVR